MTLNCTPNFAYFGHTSQIILAVLAVVILLPLSLRRNMASLGFLNAVGGRGR